MGRPLVSAIISLYQSEAFIESFLYRLRNQTMFDHVEFLFIVNVDGAHPGDLVLRSVERFSARYKKVVEVPRENLYASWNRAVRMASGEYLCNLNHDDSHFYNALQLMKTGLDRFRQLDLCYGLTRYMAAPLPKEEFDRMNKIRKTQISVREVAKRHRTECCPMWRKSVHDKLGLFDETYLAAGDHEMWVRMLDAGMRFIELGEVTSVFYRHSQSLTAKYNTRYKEIDRIIAQYGEKYR